MNHKLTAVDSTAVLVLFWLMKLEKFYIYKKLEY
jgi:hypothetical protein